MVLGQGAPEYEHRRTFEQLWKQSQRAVPHKQGIACAVDKEPPAQQAAGHHGNRPEAGPHQDQVRPTGVSTRQRQIPQGRLQHHQSPPRAPDP